MCAVKFLVGMYGSRAAPGYVKWEKMAFSTDLGIVSTGSFVQSMFSGMKFLRCLSCMMPKQAKIALSMSKMTLTLLFTNLDLHAYYRAL